jgi:hypothetical protein
VIAIGLGSAETIVIAATLQMAGAVVGVTLARLPGLPDRDEAARPPPARRA